MTNNLTRDEARDRRQLLEVLSYQVELDLTGGAETFGSVTEVRFRCASPGAVSFIELTAPAVREIVLNGTPVPPSAFDGNRITLAGLRADNELRVVADCAYSRSGEGLHRFTDPADGSVYLYSDLETFDAHRIYACFDQPDLKATFEFSVLAPADWLVLSNGAPDGPGEPAGQARRWHFPPSPVMSTYITAIVAGPYHEVKSEHDGIPLGLYCRQSLAEYLDPAELFEVTRQGFDFFHAAFGVRYAFGKYDQVFVPEFKAGAMENAGCVTFLEDYVFRSRVTDFAREMRAETILHEMAHMWFGDLVTMRWWDDLWLNESFATWASVLAESEATRWVNAWTTFCQLQKAWAYQQDQLPSTHPIAADIPDIAAVEVNFDGITYAKGASVLKQLVAYVGREEFLAGVRRYFGQHAWGNATLTDLLGALEQTSGRELADWSKAWLETAGPNTLRAEFDVAADGSLASFAITQEAPAAYPTLRPHHIAVGLYARDPAGRLTRTHRAEIDVTGPRTEVPELAGLPRPDLILVNDDDLGYARVRFDPRSLATVTQSVGDLGSSLSRAVCWTALIDMARQGELSLPAFAAAVSAGLGAENSLPVIQVLQSVTSQLLRMCDDAGQVNRIKAQLAAEGTRLLHAAAPGSDPQHAWTLLLAWTATTPEQLDLIAGLLDGSVQLPGLTVDTGLRWALLRRLAATGRAGDAQIDAELTRDHTDAGQRHALSCRAAIPDPEHKAAAWRLLAQTQELGTAGVGDVILGFALPEHAALLAPYTEQYFAVLPGIWSERGEHFRAMLTHALFPSWAASPALVERIDAFLAAGERDPGLVRLLTERRDMVQRALAPRALPG